MGSWRVRIGFPTVCSEVFYAQIYRSFRTVIPDNAKMWFIIRAATRNDIAELRARVKACFEFVRNPPIPISSANHIALARLPSLVVVNTT